MGPEGKGRDQQYETIYRNAASQHSSGLRGIVSREQQKDRSASDWIHDRKERAYHQEKTLGNLKEQANLHRLFLVFASRFGRLPVRRPLAP